MSALAQRAEQYLRLRRALGHQLDDAHRLLPRFVAFLDSLGASRITVSLMPRTVRACSTRSNARHAGGSPLRRNRPVSRVSSDSTDNRPCADKGVAAGAACSGHRSHSVAREAPIRGNKSGPCSLPGA